MNFTPGSVALVGSVLIVDGFAIAGLAGWIEPVTGAAVGLGAQVVGTVAFFGTYYVGTRNERSSARAGAADPDPEPEPADGSHVG